MKKKLLLLFVFMFMGISVMGCDLLSTINAVTGFYQEYTTYSERYETTDVMTVLSETDLTINETNVDTLNELSSRHFFKIDTTSDFLYVEERIGEESKTSVYEDDGDALYEFLIEDDKVTPRFATAEEKASADKQIFNENFSYESVENENKTGDHTYEFDVLLNQVVNLDELSDFVNQFKVFDEDLAAFDNAEAHVITTFTDEDSVIDIEATLDQYRIDFEDDQYAIITLVNHTVMSIPEDFTMPDVYSGDYNMVAADDINLALKTYAPDTPHTFYVDETAGAGWLQFDFPQGDYQLILDDGSPISTVTLYDADQNEIGVLSAGETFTVDTEGIYYLYVECQSTDLLTIAVDPVTSE